MKSYTWLIGTHACGRLTTSYRARHPLGYHALISRVSKERVECRTGALAVPPFCTQALDLKTRCSVPPKSHLNGVDRLAT